MVCNSTKLKPKFCTPQIMAASTQFLCLLCSWTFGTIINLQVQKTNYCEPVLQQFSLWYRLYDSENSWKCFLLHNHHHHHCVCSSTSLVSEENLVTTASVDWSTGLSNAMGYWNGNWNNLLKNSWAWISHKPEMTNKKHAVLLLIHVTAMFSLLLRVAWVLCTGYKHCKGLVLGDTSGMAFS